MIIQLVQLALVGLRLASNQGGWSTPTSKIILPIVYSKSHLLALRMPLRESTNTEFTSFNDFVILEKSLTNFTLNTGNKVNLNFLSIGI